MCRCGKNGANMPADRLKYSFTAHNLAKPTVALADFFHCVLCHYSLCVCVYVVYTKDCIEATPFLVNIKNNYCILNDNKNVIDFRKPRDGCL